MDNNIDLGDFSIDLDTPISKPVTESYRFVVMDVEENTIKMHHNPLYDGYVLEKPLTPKEAYEGSKHKFKRRSKSFIDGRG